MTAAAEAPRRRRVTRVTTLAVGWVLGLLTPSLIAASGGVITGLLVPLVAVAVVVLAVWVTVRLRRGRRRMADLHPHGSS